MGAKSLQVDANSILVGCQKMLITFILIIECFEDRGPEIAPRAPQVAVGIARSKKYIIKFGL
jgi:hypothetical protein